MKIVRFAPTQEIADEAGLDRKLNAAGYPDRAPVPEWMTAVEARRFRSLNTADQRSAYAAAHWLVRVCASEMLRANPQGLALVRQCGGCGKLDHGRPKILGTRLNVSLSVSRDHVAAIASEHPCGIDVERLRGPVMPRALTAEEMRWVDAQLDGAQAFARLWTRKEALAKAGCGSLVRPQSVDTLSVGPGVRLEEWASTSVRGAWCERRPEGE